MRHLLLTGGAVRLVLLLSGLWVDNNSVVPYTDVDYRVFCDAAAAVAAGGSPVRACVERVERVPPALLLSRSGRGPLLPSVRPRHLPLHAAPGLGTAAHRVAECLVRTRPATGARAWWRGPPSHRAGYFPVHRPSRARRRRGKLLFCAGDLVVAYLTASVLRSSGASEATARLGAAVTLFNPFTAAGALGEPALPCSPAPCLPG